MSATRTTQTGLGLLALAVLFIALVILSNQLLRGQRLDLTENRLYTLSPGTREMLSDIDEPINLYFFYSDRASRDIPVLRDYARRVRELLDEFVLAAEGKLNLQVIDPLPFSEDEDRAARFGLQSLPLGPGNDGVYLGLAGTNSTDGVEIIPFFQPDKEAFLEYDLAKLVYSLDQPEKPVVGILGALDLSGGFDPMTRQPIPPWVIGEQLGQLFELRNLDADTTAIDPEVDVLLLVHPKDLSEPTLYAIDQFVLGGGRALVFVDPHAEADTGGPRSGDPGNPQAGMFAERSSNLAPLFAAWGVAYDPEQVVADSRHALQVQVSAGRPPVRHPGILSLDREALADDDVITGELSTVNVSLSGFLDLAEDAPVNLEPLLRTSESAMPIAAERVRFLPDPAELMQGFRPTGERYTLAARISGPVPSAFPDGPPAPGEAGEATTETAAEHLSAADGPINLIVVADTDLLTDRLWVQTSNFFGQQIASAWANNGDFVINAVDNLVGNSALLSLRGRATANRPFTRVEELRQAADARFRAKEQELQAELRETENRLSELQRQRGQDLQDGSGALILSPEQQAEVEQLRERLLEVRQELRQVRRDLDRDIERLGDWLKFINIGLMPIVVTLVGLITALMLRRRRSAH